MCLPVSRLFWVSSLAYPNLLGTKDYVVVVVVVVTITTPAAASMLTIVLQLCFPISGKRLF
jgi:hypothetical protein